MPYGIGNLMAGIPTGDLRTLKDFWPYLLGYSISIFFLWGFFWSVSSYSHVKPSLCTYKYGNLTVACTLLYIN